MKDLESGNILGAIQKAGTTYNTFSKKGALSGAVFGDVKNVLGETVRQAGNSRTPFLSPTPGANK